MVWLNVIYDVQFREKRVKTLVKCILESGVKYLRNGNALVYKAKNAAPRKRLGRLAYGKSKSKSFRLKVRVNKKNFDQGSS